MSSLEILMTAKGNDGKQTLEYAYCYCKKYNRYGWVRLYYVKNGHTKSGKMFPIKDFTQCRDIHHYLSQFIWSKNDGYLVRVENYKKIYQHREIWELLKGKIPDHLTIDHINRIKTDNRINNLRLATMKEQTLNRGAYSNTGEKYISKPKGRNTYRVKIKQKYIGTCKTLEEAIILRDKHLQH